MQRETIRERCTNDDIRRTSENSEPHAYAGPGQPRMDSIASQRVVMDGAGYALTTALKMGLRQL